MTIPTQKAFKDWLDAAETEHAYSEETLSLLRAPPTHGAVAKYLVAALSERTSSLQTLMNETIGGWLSSQREFKRAEAIVLFGRKNSVRSLFIPEQWAMQEAERLIERARFKDRDAEATEAAWGRTVPQEWRRSRTVESVVGYGAKTFTNWHQWNVVTAKALHEYFYLDVHAVSLAASKTWTASRRDAINALERFEQLHRTVEHFDLTPLRRWRTLESTVDRLKEIPQQVPFPIDRSNPHAAERLFVYRQWAANRRASRKPKPEAIVELMGIEGFGHQYDTRTVERLCTEFSGRFTTRKQG